ncbi:MAG: haloacid dehalogenase [Dehalococcoidia bacterium]
MPEESSAGAPLEGLSAIADAVRARLEARYAAREVALGDCRQATRHAANAIRALHRSEFAAARDLLAQARQLLAQVRRALAGHPDLFHAGFVHDAQKEFAEASLTLAVVAGERLPSPPELAVEDAAYLNGLGEAVGELRRYTLDSLRSGGVARAEAVLAAMDEMYGVLVTMDYPDAMTGGLRRTTDMVRGVLERTRGDLTMASLQRELTQRLDHLRDRLRGGGQ